MAEAGHGEGLKLLKGWVQRQHTRFATVALNALILAPKEALQEGDFVAAVRQILLGEHDSIVQIRASTLLGVCSSWPEPALVYAMQHHPSPVVRGEAFRSALMLAGVPYAIARGYAGAAEYGHIQPAEALVNQIASEWRASN